MTRGTGPREQWDQLDPPDTAPPVPGLLDIADTLAAATTDYRALLWVAAQAVAASLGDAAVLWVLDDEGSSGPRPSTMTTPKPDASWPRAWTPSVTCRRPAACSSWPCAPRAPCCSRGRPSASWVNASTRPTARTTQQFGLSSLLMIPLRARGRAVGVLGVCRDEGRPPYDDDDVLFAQRVGAQIALALDNAQLLSGSLEEVRRRREVELQLIDMVSTDLLTGLGNRHLLMRGPHAPAEHRAPHRPAAARPRRFQGRQRRARPRGRRPGAAGGGRAADRRDRAPVAPSRPGWAATSSPSSATATCPTTPGSSPRTSRPRWTPASPSTAA